MTGRMQKRRVRLSFSVIGVRQQKLQPRCRPRPLPFSVHLVHLAPYKQLGPATLCCTRAPCPPWSHSNRPSRSPPRAAAPQVPDGLRLPPRTAQRAGVWANTGQEAAGGRPGASPSPFNQAMKNLLRDALQEGRCLPSLRAVLKHHGVSRRVFLELSFGSCSFELDRKRWGSSRRHRARHAQTPSPPTAQLLV